MLIKTSLSVPKTARIRKSMGEYGTKENHDSPKQEYGKPNHLLAARVQTPQLVTRTSTIPLDTIAYQAPKTKMF